MPSPAERRRYAEGGRSAATSSAVPATVGSTPQEWTRCAPVTPRRSLSRAAQRHLDLARVVDRVGRHPGERDARRERALGHTVLAVLLLGEAPRRHHAVGMALIAVGIWFAARKGGPVASRVRAGRPGPTA